MKVRFASKDTNKNLLREYKKLKNFTIKEMAKTFKISEARLYNFYKGILIPKSIIDTIFEEIPILKEKYFLKIIEILPDNWGQIKGGKITYNENFKKRKNIGSFQFLNKHELKKISSKAGKIAWEKKPKFMKKIAIKAAKLGQVALQQKKRIDPKFRNELYQKNLKSLEKARKHLKKLIDTNPEFRKKHIIKFQQNAKKKYKASNGLKVRSKIELKVAELLLKSRVPFEYEKFLNINNKIFFPDFLIGNKVIISVCCYMNEPHLQKYLKKIRLLQKFYDIIVITYSNRGKIGNWFISRIPDIIPIIFTRRIDDDLIKTLNELLNEHL